MTPSPNLHMSPGKYKGSQSKDIVLKTNAQPLQYPCILEEDSERASRNEMPAQLSVLTLKLVKNPIDSSMSCNWAMLDYSLRYQ